MTHTEPSTTHNGSARGRGAGRGRRSTPPPPPPPMSRGCYLTEEGARLTTAAPVRGMLPTSRLLALAAIGPLVIACFTVLPLSIALALGRWLLFPSHKAFAGLILGASPRDRWGAGGVGVRHSASRTSYAVTFSRHLGYLHGVNDDHLARHFLSFETLMLLTVGWLDRFVRRVPNYPIIAYVQARTIFFDRFAVNACKRQVVILGAGFDTRAHRLFTRRQMLEGQVRVFEVDIASTQAVKRATVEAVGAEAFVNRDLVDYVTVDFSRESFLEKLLEKGFDKTVETAVLFEGVSYYLEWDALESALRTISTNFKPGSLLALDFSYDVFAEKRTTTTTTSNSTVSSSTASKVQFLLAHFVKSVGEPFLSGVDPASGPREAFEPLGYELIAHLGADALSSTFLGHVAPGWENKVPYVPDILNCAVLRVVGAR